MTSSATNLTIGKSKEIPVLEVKVLDLNTMLRAKTKHTSCRVITITSKERRV
jgi:hypothetical protein